MLSLATLKPCNVKRSCSHWPFVLTVCFQPRSYCHWRFEKKKAFASASAWHDSEKVLSNYHLIILMNHKSYRRYIVDIYIIYKSLLYRIISYHCSFCLTHHITGQLGLLCCQKGFRLEVPKLHMRCDSRATAMRTSCMSGSTSWALDATGRYSTIPSWNLTPNTSQLTLADAPRRGRGQQCSNHLQGVALEP